MRLEEEREERGVRGLLTCWCVREVGFSIKNKEGVEEEMKIAKMLGRSIIVTVTVDVTITCKNRNTFYAGKERG